MGVPESLLRQAPLFAGSPGLLLAACLACAAPGDRPDYGAPAEAFQAEEVAFAENWPRAGPPLLWTRRLGPGYSGIAAAGQRLYTMFRDKSQEVVVCLDARSGEGIWEFRYRAPLPGTHDSQYGDGPNSRPLIARDRLYTIGVSGILHCLDARTGEMLWSRDLWGEFGGNELELGYSSSPILYKDTLIALTGGEERSIMAFHPETGQVAWQNLSFENSYSTPTILDIHGQEQLVTCMAREVIGADPADGSLLWRYPMVNQWQQNIARPLLLDGNRLFISTLEAGSRCLQLAPGPHFDAREVWSTSRMQLFYTDPVQIGEYIYGSSGYSASPLMTALHADTGGLAWRVRGFSVASLIKVGNRLLIFDESGKLALATPSAAGLTVHAEARVATHPARTPPTLHGTVLYLRDMRDIIALDLGR